jgi:ABC-type phosphate/phosphonate transport system substrate-binding protein
MSALRATVAPIAGKSRLPFFRRVVVSGAHLESVRHVAEANADVCAIDCVTHELIARDMPQRLEGARVLCRTPSAPALPYITSAANAERLPALRSALSAATADPALAEVREKLLIEGFDVLPENAYDRIRELEERAAAQGYPELR